MFLCTSTQQEPNLIIITLCNVYHLLYNLPFVLLGKMKGIAFVQDPDGYWIEILNGENLVKVTKEFSS